MFLCDSRSNPFWQSSCAVSDESVAQPLRFVVSIQTIPDQTVGVEFIIPKVEICNNERMIKAVSKSAASITITKLKQEISKSQKCLEALRRLIREVVAIRTRSGNLIFHVLHVLDGTEMKNAFQICLHLPGTQPLRLALVIDSKSLFLALHLVSYHFLVFNSRSVIDPSIVR
jgi:hypothetical protein